jgi:drug/metabolite transporter (DMT)-like permease
MVLSSSTKFFCGVGAAVFAPFLMVLGFMIWDDHWTKKKGSAFSLNMFKCNLTALWFLIVIIAINIAKEVEQSSTSTTTFTVSGTALTSSIKIICTKLNPFHNEDVKFLFVSSTVGILIGDWAWIEGLKYLGARKVIVMDSLKPFLAALAGWVFFNEKFNKPFTASIGLLLTVVGVAFVGLEEEGEKDQEKQEYGRIMDADDHNQIHNSINASNTTNDQGSKMTESYYYGIFMAILNVVLHTLGATLTKQFGADMTTWEINFVRFGFSGLCMLLLTLLLQIRDRILQTYLGLSQPMQLQPTDSTISLTTGTQRYGSVPTLAIITPASPFHSYDSNHQESHWYSLPELSRSSWIRVTVGVVFVSFMHP